MAFSANFLNLWDLQETLWYPLNISTPTLAPDRGGPVACLGGPVACRGGPVACLEMLWTLYVEGDLLTFS